MSKFKIFLRIFLGCTILSQFVPAEAQASRATARFHRVIYVVLENKDYRDVLGNPSFKEWATMGANMTNFFAETHPSQPNYIAMIAGDTLGVNSNGTYSLAERHLGDLIEEKGLTWKAYAEDYPDHCFLGASSGSYARKHVPFLSFANIQKNPKRCANVINFKTFLEDWRLNKIANFNMIIPNNKSNGHDTNIPTSAAWIEKHFGAALKDPKMMKDTLVIITYDEGSYSLKNQIYTVLIGPSVQTGVANNDRHSHYSLLRLIEDEWGLANLGRGDLAASGILQIWK